MEGFFLFVFLPFGWEAGLLGLAVVIQAGKILLLGADGTVALRTLPTSRVGSS